jgi:fumarylacetoacetase
VDVPTDSDFPIQNLPFGIFSTQQSPARAGVAIGEFIVDLAYLHKKGYFRQLSLPAGVFARPSLNEFLSLGRKKLRAVRERVSELLRFENDQLQSKKAARKEALIPQKRAKMLLPVSVSNYTDFYSSEEHAANVGSMFRDPRNPLLPNWKHLPVAYHGRASSIVVSGTDIRRPKGQVKPGDSASPEFRATRRLDFELEVAFITCGENQLGTAIPITKAEESIAG